MRWLILLLLPLTAWTSTARADDEVTICYNWGCEVKARVVFSYRDLDRITREDAGASRDRGADGFVILVEQARETGRSGGARGDPRPFRNCRPGRISKPGSNSA